MKNLLLVLLAYTVAGFALFGPYLDDPFLMDDEIQVTNNVHIQTLSEWPQYFTSSTMDSGGSSKMGGIYFKPFMTLYFASIWHLFPNDAAAFRVPLLIMHILSALMIYIFLAKFFDSRVAFALGGIFVIHPINSEIVAYIADAQDALYMFFGMAALTAFMQIRRPLLNSLVVAALLMSAILGKETGALFFAILPIYAFLFERKATTRALITACVTFAAYMVLRVHSGLLTYEHKVLLIQQASYIERLMTIPLIVWHYIEIFFVPVRISLVTDFAVHSLNVDQFWLPLAGDIVAAGLLYGLWKTLRSDVEKKLFAFASAVLTLWFLLHGSILLPLDGTYADRWFYLADFALLTLLALAATKLFESRAKLRTPAAIFAGLVAIAFTARTVVRLNDWAIPMHLYEREFAQRPFDALMANNVGYEYFHRGDIRAAEKYFDIATQNNPGWDVAWNNLGAAAQRLQEYDRALALYKKSADLGTYYLAYENYASLLCAKAIDQACRDFLARALSVLPLNPKLNEINDIIQKQKSPSP